MRRSRVPFTLLFLLAAFTLIASCGGGGDGTPSSGTQMGGSIQGVPLSLSDTAATFAGTPLTGSADGVGTAARFFRPRGPKALRVPLRGGHRQPHDPQDIDRHRGGDDAGGQPGSSGSADGTGSAARFNGPGGIATDGANLYVTDSGNNTIRKVTVAGWVTTLAGSPAASGSQTARGRWPASIFPMTSRRT